MQKEEKDDLLKYLTYLLKYLTQTYFSKFKNFLN